MCRMHAIDTDLLENLDLRLCLSSTVGVVTPSVDEGLQVFAIVHLCVIFFAEVTVTFRFRGVELREISEAHVKRQG